jgi:hypothetical protein
LLDFLVGTVDLEDSTIIVPLAVVGYAPLGAEVLMLLNAQIIDIDLFPRLNAYHTSSISP